MFDAGVIAGGVEFLTAYRLQGKFDSFDTIGLLGPDETYEFVLTQAGEYA